MNGSIAMLRQDLATLQTDNQMDVHQMMCHLLNFIAGQPMELSKKLGLCQCWHLHVLAGCVMQKRHTAAIFCHTSAQPEAHRYA